MNTTLLNQYKASFADSTELSVNAGTMEDALVVLKASKANEPTIIHKTIEGIAVAIPEPAIGLRTVVTSAEAETAGCKATPYVINSIKRGEKVWFTAIPVTGYHFVGWFLDDELLSTDVSYEATITYAGQTPVILEYEAQFEAD